ncbi:MAG: magnesium transporter [Candidatus Bathyarchaeia archaeon]
MNKSFTPKISKSFMWTFTQSVLSLSIDFGGLVAGAFLALYLEPLSSVPWGLLIFPGLLSVRGSIGGMSSSRLGTALHLGTIQARFTNNTRDYYLLLAAIATMNLVSCFVLSVLSTFFGLLFLNVKIGDFPDILGVLLLTMGLSIVFITPLTIGIAILSFKKGLDPDIIVYPVISTLADIAVTLCYVLAVTGYFSSSFGRYLIWIIDSVFIVVVGTIFVKNSREKEYLKMVREFFITLIIIATIVNVSGISLNKIRESIGRKPGVFMVYPALIDAVGDVGSIIGSTATTKLALGLLSPSITSMKDHASTICAAWSSSTIMFFMFSVVVSLFYNSFSSRFIPFSLQLLTTNVLAVPPIILITYATSTITYKRGLDPDNFTVPIESSLADAITTLSLLVAVTAFS